MTKHLVHLFYLLPDNGYIRLCYQHNYPEPAFSRVMECGQAAHPAVAPSEIVYMDEIL